jgi:hypothetical protein
MVTIGTNAKGEHDLGLVGARTKVKAPQEHPKDQKIRIGFNNIDF